MHLLLTDALHCPRCGPEFGLILLADTLLDRQVLQGSLGCANCREAYPIRDGVPDLRVGGSAGTVPVLPLLPDPERALRIAALLGLGDSPGTVVIWTGSAALVEEVARFLPNARVVGAAFAEPAGGFAGGLDWILHGAVLPLRPRSVHGAVVAGMDPIPLLTEVRRVLRPEARLVLDPAAPGSAAVLRAAGLTVLLDQEPVAVASGTEAG